MKQEMWNQIGNPMSSELFPALTRTAYELMCSHEQET